MGRLIIGIILVCLGVGITTIGGYMAKDGWENLKKRKIPNASDQKPFIQQKVIGNGNMQIATSGNVNIDNRKIEIATHNEKIINSFVLEARLTCDLKENEKLPPSTVEFIAMGNSHAHLKGAAGDIQLSFQSPVVFRKQEGDKIVVINKFSMNKGTELEGKPIKTLKNYSSLSIPIVTVVYGKSLSKFTLLEISVILNGDNFWYESYNYNNEFQQGPRFEVPLENLHKKIELR